MIAFAKPTLCCVLIFFAPIDDKARGRRIVTAALEKQGGAQALASIRGYEMHASGLRTGKRVTVARRVLRMPTLCIDEDARRYLDEDRVESMRTVVRGTIGRTLRRGSWSSLPPSEIRRQQARYHRTPIGIYSAFADPAVVIRHVRTVDDGGAPREVVAIERAGELPLTVTIDPADGRLLEAGWVETSRGRSGAPPAKWVVKFERHAPFGSLRAVPTRIVHLRNGTRLAQRTTDRLRINPPLTPADFPAGDQAPADRTQSR